MVFENIRIDEAEVSKAIIEEFMNELKEMTDNDVIIVGSGPAGTVAAKKLAEKGVNPLLIERNIKPGGGMYLGGMLMNKLVVEKPSLYLLEESGIKSIKKHGENLYVANAYEVSTKLLASAFDAGARLLNAVEVTDVVHRKNKINGVVANWHAVSALPNWITCADPLPLKSKVVIDATGHQAEIAKVAGEKLGFEVRGKEGSMWMEEAEKATIQNTKEIYPGLIVTGMAANSCSGLPRMGPLFGAMFQSGVKAAEIASQKIKKRRPVRVRENVGRGRT